MNYSLIIKEAFNILIKGEHFSRLEKVGKIVSNLFESQMKTDNGKKRKRKHRKKEKKKKKRKVVEEKVRKTKLWQGLSDVFIPPELIIEIALHIPYKDLQNFMEIDKFLNETLKSNYFWWRKFRTEYVGFGYPNLIEIVNVNNPKNDWKKLTQRLFSKIKDLEESLENTLFTPEWIEPNKNVFKAGNELILKEIIKTDSTWRKDNLVNLYFNEAKVFNMTFLLYLINEYPDQSWFQSWFQIHVLGILFSQKYKDRIPDKKKLIIAYLKKTYTKRFYNKGWNFYNYLGDAVQENLNIVYRNEKTLFFDKKFIREAIKINGIMLIYLIKLNRDFGSNKELIFEALKTSSEVILYINKKLRNDEKFVFDAIKINPNIWNYEKNTIYVK